MYTLHPDVYLTRRQRLHFVMDDDGVLLWSGKSLLHALVFLSHKEQTEFMVEGGEDEDRFRVKIRADLTTTDPAT